MKVQGKELNLYYHPLEDIQYFEWNYYSCNLLGTTGGCLVIRTLWKIVRYSEIWGQWYGQYPVADDMVFYVSYKGLWIIVFQKAHFWKFIYTIEVNGIVRALWNTSTLWIKWIIFHQILQCYWWFNGLEMYSVPVDDRWRYVYDISVEGKVDKERSKNSGFLRFTINIVSIKVEDLSTTEIDAVMEQTTVVHDMTR